MLEMTPLWSVLMAGAGSPASARQERLYAEAADQLGPALERLSRGYERDGERRRDLLQEIHVALWRSFASFDARCSLRTWVYRVAHNVAASRVARDQRARVGRWVSLVELDGAASPDDTERSAADRQALERLLELVQRLQPLDRQLMLLYLEDLDAAGIGEVLGLSPANVATKVHRIKRVLAKHFEGPPAPAPGAALETRSQP